MYMMLSLSPYVLLKCHLFCENFPQPCHRAARHREVLLPLKSQLWECFSICPLSHGNICRSMALHSGHLIIWEGNAAWSLGLSPNPHSTSSSIGKGCYPYLGVLAGIYIYTIIKWGLLDFLIWLEAGWSHNGHLQAGKAENPVATQSKKLETSVQQRLRMWLQSQAEGFLRVAGMSLH